MLALRKESAVVHRYFKNKMCSTGSVKTGPLLYPLMAWVVVGNGVLCENMQCTLAQDQRELGGTKENRTAIFSLQDSHNPRTFHEASFLKGLQHTFQYHYSGNIAFNCMEL